MPRTRLSPIATAYVSVNWKETNGPVPTPTPVPASTYPSGITPPAVASGFTRALFDDFTESSLSSAWNQYNGINSQGAIWLESHLSLTNSVLSLNAYQDPSGIAAAIKAGADFTQAQATKQLNWAEAGLQTATRWPVGTTFSVAMRADSYDGLTDILLTMGNNWPPEIDFQEGGNMFVHWGQGNSQKYLGYINVDRTQWHLYQLQWTTATIVVSCDGATVATFPNPDNGNADPYGLLSNMFLSMQWQTGDGGTIGNDPTVTAQNSKQMQIDWVAIDTPEII